MGCFVLDRVELNYVEAAPIQAYELCFLVGGEVLRYLWAGGVLHIMEDPGSCAFTGMTQLIILVSCDFQDGDYGKFSDSKFIEHEHLESWFCLILVRGGHCLTIHT